MTDELWRLDVEHEYPASRTSITARATIARTVHGLASHGTVDVITERSQPDRLTFTMRVADDVRDGLLAVAQALPSGPVWEVGWTKLDE